MMRLFIGLEVPCGCRDALAAWQDRLRAAGVSAGYVAPSNLHLTLAFIGMRMEAPTGLLPRVHRPFSITVSHLGLFPKARVLWAGVEQSAALNELAERVRRGLQEAQIPFDPKPFYPHITLGRKPKLPEGMELSAFAVPPVEMAVRQVCLYRSDRVESGMAYTVIGRGNAPDGTP